MRDWRALMLVPAAVAVPHWACAATYLTVEQAQHILFPGIPLKSQTIHLTEDQKHAIEQHSGVRVRVDDPQVWRAPDGAAFIVDQVIGKHEFITYAVGIDAAGALRGVEILEYRESY
ncbi:MAG: FMN-binding protein, partial [Betaproteobacteria bacterium]|nr:FMN-binding protein [Betaproteobacteria bacterium]